MEWTGWAELVQRSTKPFGPGLEGGGRVVPKKMSSAYIIIIIICGDPIMCFLGRSLDLSRVLLFLLCFLDIHNMCQGSSLNSHFFQKKPSEV